MKQRLLRFRYWKVIVWLIPFLALGVIEAVRAAQAWQSVQNAAQTAARFAATGGYDSTYCGDYDPLTQQGCASEAEEDAARLQTIYAVARNAMSGIPGEDLKIVVCSNQVGYTYDATRAVCLPRDDPGASGSQVVVHIAYDYLVGSFLGTGVGALPLQATREAVVERFRAVRLAGVPPTVSVPGQSNESSASQVSESIVFASYAAQSQSQEQKVIQSADMQLVIADADASLARINDLVAEAGGYVVKSELWSDGEFRSARAEIRVPADKFEATMERLKEMAMQVLRETVTGQDVTEEYVDLDSRLKGLRATVDRLQGLLVEAKTVDEALHVSAELGRIEEQIEQITGRMKYLDNRVEFSTITILLEPDRPVPTPTPLAWQPGTTIERATGFLGASARLAGDVLIWGAIVGIPFALIVFGVRRLLRRARRRGRSG